MCPNVWWVVYVLKCIFMLANLETAWTIKGFRHTKHLFTFLCISCFHVLWRKQWLLVPRQRPMISLQAWQRSCHQHHRTRNVNTMDHLRQRPNTCPDQKRGAKKEERNAVWHFAKKAKGQTIYPSPLLVSVTLSFSCTSMFPAFFKGKICWLDLPSGAETLMV